jgi:outer membrane biosynthesis protein TonB
VAKQDDEDDEGSEARDYIMARSASALASLDAAKAALYEMLGHFNIPDDDGKGKERKALADTALEASSHATRALEDIGEMFSEDLPTETFTAVEPWEEEEPEEDEDEEPEPRKRSRR